jgi:hypothetical protein
MSKTYPENCFIYLVISGIDIGFDIKRNLSGELYESLSFTLEVSILMLRKSKL